ncbi:hypothetical protein BDR07DRAFT_1460974 [Suillus spraguei]|nr:hypothetical protein BDR07DRAFT_1460974 [Suillus spraguei]
MFNANPADGEELDNDPGAYIIFFGKHSGKRLDSVPNDYRLWATGAERRGFPWYTDLKEANDRYEEQLLLQTPEAYTLSFGKHKNKRLDEVPEDYIWSVIRPSFSDNIWYKSLVKAHRCYLDKVYRNKSPGSVDIWFGKYRGYSLAWAYERHGFIKFCLRPEHDNFKWYHRFKDLVQRYEAHRAAHRRPHRGRKPANVQNPVGELLGPWVDRGSVEPSDEYVRDGFVVDDGEGEDEDFQEEGNGSESDSGNGDRGFNDDFQGEDVYDDSEVDTADLDGSSESDSDSDDDTPLDELFTKINARCVAGKRKAEVVSSPSLKRSHQCEGENSDDDAVAQPPRSRKGPRLGHDRPANNAEPVASTSHLDKQTCSGSFQESTASSSPADESQIEDESSQIDGEERSDDGSPSVLGSYYRPFPRVITGTYYQEMP